MEQGVPSAAAVGISDEQDDSAESFDRAFDRLFGDAYRVAFRLLGSRDDAADVAQEALARACVRWKRVSAGGRDPAPWVTRVAANVALDRWRRQRTAAKYSSLVAVAPGVAQLPDRVDLHRALAALPKRQREVVVLRYVADLREDAVAAALGCSVGTVKTHASRGLAALRAALSDDTDEEG